MSHTRLRLLAVMAATGLALVLLAAALPARAFFAGDSGLKLIASWNAIAHPSRPLEIDLPRIGGRPVPYVGHMMSVHDDHAHALQSPLFPVLSAPWIAMLGVRGASVLPIVSFVLLVPIVEAIRRRAAPEAPMAVTLTIAVAANPVLFYALEYWEHAPAIALAGGSLAAALASRAASESARRQALVSGVLGGSSAILRPEAAWCVVATLLIVDRRHWMAFTGAAAAVFIPFGAANLLHSGELLGPHTAQNLAPLQSDWIAARWSRLRAWVWPSSVMAALGLALIGVGWLSSVAGWSLRVRQLIALTGGAVVAVVASQRDLPRDSLWQAFPIVLLALTPSSSTPIVRRLHAFVAIVAVAIVATATHDGGAQWGPRFLLINTAILLVLSARAVGDAAGPGWARPARVALVAIVLFAGVAASRAGYRELRGAKRVYDRIVAETSAFTQPGDAIVTNVWWFDQVTAALAPTRTYLLVRSVAEATTVLGELDRAGTSHVALVWSDEPGSESLETAGSLEKAVDGTCFTLDQQRSTAERQLHFAFATCRR